MRLVLSNRLRVLHGEALRIINAHRSKVRDQFIDLDAFGDRLHIHGACDLRHGLDDDIAGRPIQNRFDKLAIDFDELDRQTTEVGKRCHTAAKVIECEPEAQIDQLSHSLGGAIDIGHRCRFGNLEAYLTRTNCGIFGKCVFDQALKTRGTQRDARQVDELADIILLLVCQRLKVGKGLADDVVIEVLDDTKAFRCGNEARRIDYGAIGIGEPRQNFVKAS